MDLRFPELDPVPQEQRWAILTDAVRTANATHGKMGRGPHYAGMALTAIVILPLVIMDAGVISAIFAGMAAYIACLVVGILLWRRAMIRELRRTIARAVAARGQQVPDGDVATPPAPAQEERTLDYESRDAGPPEPPAWPLVLFWVVVILGFSFVLWLIARVSN